MFFRSTHFFVDDCFGSFNSLLLISSLKTLTHTLNSSHLTTDAVCRREETDDKNEGSFNDHIKIVSERNIDSE